VLSTFGEIAWIPTAQALAADLAPPAQRGAYLGAFDGSVSLAYAVGPMGETVLRITQFLVPFVRSKVKPAFSNRPRVPL
jgi:MFS family permease